MTAATHEREALAEWARRRRRRIRSVDLGESDEYVRGYEAALDDIENLLLVREQRVVSA